MANNRLYLKHKSTGKSVYLGKRMGWGWYGVPEDVKQRIEDLFKIVEDESAFEDQDEFYVELEVSD